MSASPILKLLKIGATYQDVLQVLQSDTPSGPRGSRADAVEKRDGEFDRDQATIECSVVINAEVLNEFRCHERSGVARSQAVT